MQFGNRMKDLTNDFETFKNILRANDKSNETKIAEERNVVKSAEEI